MAGFLLEIGSEEIPDWMIEYALASLRDSFSERRAERRARTSHSPRYPATTGAPRPPASICQLADVNQVIPGPYFSAGEKAALGFAKKNNTTVEELFKKKPDAKGQRYFSRHPVKQGRVGALPNTNPRHSRMIHRRSLPKTMYWIATARCGSFARSAGSSRCWTTRSFRSRSRA